jgi:putative transport protein
VTAFAVALRENPELAIFLTLAIGFLIGRARLGGFKLGNVVGTLLAGVLVGQLAIDIAPVVKAVFFSLFLFATGYKVGPQFFRGLKKSAVNEVVVTIVLCVSSLLVTFSVGKMLGYDPGTAAGLMAGAFTESTVIGTAGETINRLAVGDGERQRLLSNIPVAYAVTYLVGTSFVVWLLSSLAPRLLRINLKEESLLLEAQMAVSHGGEQRGRTTYRGWDIRAFRLCDSWAGQRVGELEQSYAPNRAFVLRIRRAGITKPMPDTVLAGGDVVAIAAPRPAFFMPSRPVGQEVEDQELLDLPLDVRDVVLTRRSLAGQTLAKIAAQHGRGVVLVRLVRGGQEIPFSAGTVLDRGDLLRLTGVREEVERVGAALGYLEPQTHDTDVVFVGLGICMGGLIGLMSVTVAGVPLSLTASGGALIMGLVFGWLRSVRPTFGRIPEPALWVFDTIGLTAFIGIVGITAGPGFVSGLRATGPALLLVGLAVAAIPHITAILVGRYFLKMNPVILLGACAGAGTATAALRAIQDEADSKLPVLGYTVPYALGNILLTAWGPVIVMLMS